MADSLNVGGEENVAGQQVPGQVPGQGSQNAMNSGPPPAPNTPEALIAEMAEQIRELRQSADILRHLIGNSLAIRGIKALL